MKYSDLCDREKLIRDVWGKGKTFPKGSPHLCVPLPIEVSPYPLKWDSDAVHAPTTASYLEFRRGTEYLRDMVRHFVECEWFLVEEHLERRQ